MEQSEAIILWKNEFAEEPSAIYRYSIGYDNCVFGVLFHDEKYILRCNLRSDAYKDTIILLEKLNNAGVCVPKMIRNGTFGRYDFLILTYLEGKELWEIYPELGDEEKKTIAREIIDIQNRVSTIKVENIGQDWSWIDYVMEMLNRANERICANGWFDIERVERLRNKMQALNDYFMSIRPIAYLDDVSTKNILIDRGRISGIIDVDWLEVGDRLTYVALTNMALLDKEYDTKYVEYILEEMHADEQMKKVVLFYTLLFCVDFMGERGMSFDNDTKVSVDQKIIDRLNGIYDLLWNEWTGQI